jgi:DNA-binding PadR family transcriptional regulator
VPGARRRTSEAAAEAVAALPRAGRGAGSGDPLIGDLRRAGLLPLLVLHYVEREPSYGNQLIERIQALTAGALAVNPNTMYPLLRSLETQGLVEGAWEHPERRSRRFYRITEAGAAERVRLAVELGPRLDRIARSIDAIRAEAL